MSNESMALLLLITAVMVAIAWLAAWSRRGDAGIVRHVVLAVGLLGLVALLAVAPVVLGAPKPLTWEWRAWPKESKVTGAQFRPGIAIYIMVDRRDGRGPTLYAMVWDDRKAAALAQALKDGIEQTGEPNAMMGWREDASQERREPMFYPMPVLPSPPKPEAEPTPFFTPM